MTAVTADLNALVRRGLKFGTVMADPPWSYSNQATRASTSNHYETLTVSQLCELPVRELSADAAHLWLWTTNAFLFDCPRLFDAWGYEFKSSYVWCLTGATRVYVRTAEYGERPATLQTLVTKCPPERAQLWNGTKWTQVLGWSKTVSPQESYKFQLRSGECIECTAEHVWPTQRGELRADELRVGDVIQTCRLPEPASPDSPVHLPDDDIGWLLGTFLADGSHAANGRSLQIASHCDETERTERLARIAAAYGGTCRAYAGGGKSLSVHVNCPALCATVRQYIFGESARRKHLTHYCWQRSNNFLRSLLLAYLEGDGHYEARSRRWRLGFTENDALAADLRTVCARLGYRLRLRRCTHQSQWGPFKGWRGNLLTEPASGHPNVKQDAEIVSFRKGKSKDFYDVSVADTPNLFALASGVLTHNCKPQMGIGNYLRNSHEFLLLAVRGGLTAAARNVMSWGAFDRTRHSAKPEAVRRSVVEPISPGPRLELFGRKPADGWVVMGDQIERSMYDTDVEELT